jgi:glutathione S-transferase
MSSTSNFIIYGSVPFAGLSDMSPFVVKLESYFRLAGLDYTKKTGNLLLAPRGKIPFLEHGGELHPDSELIIRYLREQGIADLDAELDAEQRNEITALRSMLEFELYFIASWFRYCDPRGWKRYRTPATEYFAALGIPRVLMPLPLSIVRRKFAKALDNQGVARRPAAEHYGRIHELLDALEQFKRGHDGHYWFGARPTSADALVHAFVACLVVPQLDVGCEGMLEGRPRLAAWFERVHAQLCHL